MTHTNSEKGQIVILLALVLVGLLGFTALAIDGGMVYSDRRLAQSAADASALAGAGIAAKEMDDHGVTYGSFSCGSSRVTDALNKAVEASIQRAANNDFTIDTDLSDHMGVEVSCHSDAIGPFYDHYLEIHVVVSMDSTTAFAHMFTGSANIRNTVEAVARIRPRSPVAYGNAIVSLKQDCSNTNDGISYDGGGSNTVTITGGGVYSNACMNMKGGVSIVVQADTPGDPSPGIYYNSTYHQAGASGYVSPAPQKQDFKIPIYLPPALDCNAPNAYRYDHTVRISNHETLDLAPGLHCFSNGLTATGGTIRGSEVTLYILSGDFNVSGSTDIVLSAPTVETSPALKGMLIYMAPSNHGNISLQGNATSMYTGTVYAPSGDIDVGGTSSTMRTIRTQLVGESVKLHGNVDVDIRFIEEDNAPILPKLELYK